jgi:hypothetical protein
MTQRCTRAGDTLSTWLTAIFSLAAAIAVGFGVYLAFGQEDSEALESPLMFSVARQLVEGPWGLYGPFGARNPQVLIHGPFYYHLAALFAWPIHRAGVDPIWASLAAGRAISFVGLCWTVAVAYWLARIDGARPRAGLWAALLIVASPVVDVMPYSVRPDMLGIALQTTGILLVLSTREFARPAAWLLPTAFAAFGLAACVKQQFVAAATISALILLAACLKGRLPFNFVVRGLTTGLAIVLLVYGLEELATGGRMSQAAFQAAVATSRIHPGNWTRTFIVSFTVFGKNSGLLALLVAAGLAGIRERQTIARRALKVVGLFLIVMIAMRSAPLSFGGKLKYWDAVVPTVNVAIAVFFIIPACFLLSKKTVAAGRVDTVFLVYLAAELLVVLLLSRASTGAWVNYGIQAVVFASILTARALDRACDLVASSRACVPFVLAVVVVFCNVIDGVREIAGVRLYARLALARIFENYRRPTSEFFFVSRPGDNRLYGQPALVYDEWLYPVFESIHLAEPRSVWLSRALVADRINYVVTTSDSTTIDGLGRSFREMGYRRGIKVGTFLVWERTGFLSPPSH